MKISELRAREDFDRALRETVSGVQACDAALDGAEAGDAVCWYEHPWFSVYARPGLCREGREFLCGQYGHAPRAWRRAVQWGAVRLMSLPRVFGAVLRPSFWCGVPGDADAAMWQPGNRRMRRFDFGRRSVRVYPKAGFDDGGIGREIAFRTSHGFPWVVPVLRHCGTCLEEPLLDARPIDREPDAGRRREAERAMRDAVRELGDGGREVLTGREYADRKRGEYEALRREFLARFAGVCPDTMDAVMGRALREAERMPEVECAPSHGDLQPGNVLVPMRGPVHVWLIDWEDFDVRASCYDEMVWTLGSRFACGLAQRVRRYLDENGVEGSRRVCLWAIEEWIWLMRTSAGGIRRLPEGVGMHLVEAARFLGAM